MSAAAQPLAVSPRGVVALPSTTTDQTGATFTIAGLSGIARRGGDEFLAVMDNSNKLVRLAITFTASGTIVSASVLGGITIEQTRDFEGIAINHAAGVESVLLAEEGTPAMHEYRLSDGAWMRTIEAPPVFSNRRDNFGLESLTRRAITGDVWTANEEALTVDGPLSTSSAGTLVRLVRFAGPAASVADRQWALRTQPIHGAVISGSRSGVVDLVALPSGRVLAMERSLAFSLAGAFQTRIYELDTSLATEVSAIAGLAGESFTPVTKRLLYQGSLNNLEGLCLGPQLPGGGYAMIGVVDDGDPISNNALAAFELTGGPGMIACPADVNGDGVLSVQDLFDFLAAFFTTDPAADVNGSGTITVQDLFDFLTIYFQSCT